MVWFDVFPLASTEVTVLILNTLGVLAWNVLMKPVKQYLVIFSNKYWVQTLYSVGDRQGARSSQKM